MEELENGKQTLNLQTIKQDKSQIMYFMFDIKELRCLKPCRFADYNTLLFLAWFHFLFAAFLGRYLTALVSNTTQASFHSLKQIGSLELHARTSLSHCWSLQLSLTVEENPIALYSCIPFVSEHCSQCCLQRMEIGPLLELHPHEL